MLEKAEKTVTKLMDVTARKEWSNAEATADVALDGKGSVANFHSETTSCMIFLCHPR
jgi:hypothetical protein